MGIKLNVLCGNSRSSKKTSQLKTLLGLAVSRIAILRNQRQVRCNHARSDLAHLLELAQPDRALLRSELVIKEQNMLDVFDMLEDYCHLIIERVILLEHEMDCPDELREAIASLIYASWRSGEMPELQHIRQMFVSMFGKEFINAAVELRNNCGVNPKMIQKMSTRQPSLESRIRLTKEIATERGLTLDINEDGSFTARIAKVVLTHNKNEGRRASDSSIISSSSSTKTAHKYKDVASAAQAAFTSAEDAAAAALAAVELSQSSHFSNDDHNSKKDKDEHSKQDQNKKEMSELSNLENINISPVKYYSSESDDEEVAKLLPNKHKHLRSDSYVLYSDDKHGDNCKNKSTFGTDLAKKNGKDILPDNKSESEIEKQQGLSFEDRSIQSKESNGAASDEGLSENQEASNLNPIYQYGNPVKKYGENLNSSLYFKNNETITEADKLAASSSPTEIVQQASTKDLPTQKVMRKAVSVRTRRGIVR